METGNSRKRGTAMNVENKTMQTEKAFVKDVAIGLRERADKTQGVSRRSALKRAFAVAAIAVAVMLVSQSAAMAAVAATKHNFGSMSTAAIKTQDTSEICVFCHTPHNSVPAQGIWNKQIPGDIYNVYASQTIVAAVGQPTGSSKLCLSCHDGTIAVGSLLNLPGPVSPMAGTLNVTGAGLTAGAINTTSASYIGTDLTNDHPISFNYSLSYPSNVEIKSSGTFPSQVKLDSANKLQCTTCHDPHGTNYPKFMVTSLDNGTLCNTCHDKRYWNTMPAVHRDAITVWNGAGVNPWHIDMGATGYTNDTPTVQSCFICHRSHGGAAGKELLKGTNPATSAVTDEEWTCLNCHNGNATAKDVEPEFSMLSKHDVKGYVGKHIPSRSVAGDPVRELQATLGYNVPANRHAECADCHNGHGAKADNHTIGGVNGNIIANNILGSWGVKPTLPWPAAGMASTTFTVVDFTTVLPGGDNLEGYLCLKCHSYYGYGTSLITVPSGNADNSLVYESDPTADFNVNNPSYHPVFAQGANMPAVLANPNWPLNNLGLTNTFRYVDFPGIGARTGWYSMTHDSTITCTDCHSSSSLAGVPTGPKGAHGSAEKWILRRNETGAGSSTNFCYNCHRRDVYGDEGYVGINANYSRVSHPVDGLGASSPFYQLGAKTGNDANKFGILCLTCHGGAYDTVNNVMKGIHGSNLPAGTLGGSQALAKRMMNGSCVESYTPPTTLVAGTMQFRVVNMTSDNDKVCRNNFTTPLSTVMGTYDY
jgi:predicted CXXCH cytochrome family protein